jgi:phosphate-selective porin
LGATYPASIQEAYANAASGATMEIQAMDFTEGIVFDTNKTVTLKGGLTCDFAGIAGYTTINGMQTVELGTVIMDRIVIK